MSIIMNEKRLNEWHFDFGLCATSAHQLISDSKCEELLEVIIAWAEKNNLGIGGGYREYADDDINGGKLK